MPEERVGKQQLRAHRQVYPKAGKSLLLSSWHPREKVLKV